MANRYQYQTNAGDHDDRRGATSHAIDNDPLRELARLIGQTDPNSGFASGQHQPHADEQYAEHEHLEPALEGPSWMRTAQGGHQSPIGGRATPQALPPVEYDQGPPPLSQAPAFLRTARQQREAAQPQYDQSSRYDEALYGQNPDNVQYQDQYDHQGQPQAGYGDQYDPNGYPPVYAEDEQDLPRKRSGLFTVGVVLTLAFVGTASAFAYRSYMGSPRSGEPPVIKAEPGANKIVPQQAADAAGKINDRIGVANAPERVVPREEQPVDINARAQPRVVFPPLNQNNNPPSVQSVSTTAPIVAPSPPVNSVAGDEPRRVRTTSIRPNQTDANAAVPVLTRPTPSTTAARAQAPAGQVSSGNGPMSLSPQSANTPARTAAVSPSASTGSSGGYVVQISSQKSEADAQASFRAIQSKFPNVLGSRSALIRRADLGERGIYYRAMVGPFGGADDASQLCNSLKSAGGQCVVQRN